MLMLGFIFSPQPPRLGDPQVNRGVGAVVGRIVQRAQELLERRDRFSGQILKPDAVVGDVLLELRVALNQRDQAPEHLVGQLQVGECDRCFHGGSSLLNFPDLNL